MLSRANYGPFLGPVKSERGEFVGEYGGECSGESGGESCGEHYSLGGEYSGERPGESGGEKLVNVVVKLQPFHTFFVFLGPKMAPFWKKYIGW